ncbi:peroxiredoxin [Novosphingobium sediminicola]|uniref:thioredoxin-dependent peroxiredoxin n=1 Tax=Novosphingobium sediminicola TaxID=563162 RepID=A0A7W6CEN9_9SPHN|nr:peroxiredoxin [Novosphingobium sediminicola]
MMHPRNLLAPALAAFAAAAMMSAPAHAELAVGAAAPAFVTQGAKAGKPFTFDLKKALKNGPVVVYFYPKAFTKGCTLEAHAFAEATDDFAKAGAMVIGMSADDLPTLEKFSTMECRGKFPVAIADAGIIKNYDVALSIPGLSAAVTKRTSYVIGKDGKIKLAFTDMDYKDHVSKTLATVQGLAGKH